jgi:hypothetical protein
MVVSPFYHKPSPADARAEMAEKWRDGVPPVQSGGGAQLSTTVIL